MPLYAYQCKECGAERDQFNRVSDRHTNVPTCAQHGAMALRIMPNLGYVQRDCHYICPATGQQVTNHRQRRRIMEENGFIDANDFKPEKAFEKAEREWQRNEELIASVKHPLSDAALSELCA